MPVNIISTPNMETWQLPTNVSGTPIDFAETAEQLAVDTSPTKGLMERLAESRASRLFAWGSTLACALAFAGPAGSRNSAKSAEKAAIVAAAETPGVQAFEVVASNDPIQTPSPELITSLHGVQTYFNKNGNGLRVKFREKADGSYSVPIVRIDMTQEALANANEAEVFKAVQATLPDESGINMTNLGYVKGANFRASCTPVAGSLPNPENLGIVSLQSNCTHPDRTPGFGARDVQAAFAIIFASKITWFVRDDKDTMNFDKVPFWGLTYINHSRKYDNIHSSSLFQRYLPIEIIGPGGYKTSPEPNSCREDCGTTPLFTQGQPVTITAQPNTNGEFRAWQNCPAPEGNTCKVDLGNIANDPMQLIKPITAKFVDKSPPPKEKYTLRADVTKGMKLGSLVLNGEKRKRDHIVYPTTQKGKVVMVKLVPEQNNYYVKSEKGCENEQLKKELAVDIGRCYVKLDGKNFGRTSNIEQVRITFAKKVPIEK